MPSFVRAGKYTELSAADAKALYQLAGLRWKPPQGSLELRGRYVAHRKGDKPVAPARPRQKRLDPWQDAKGASEKKRMVRRGKPRR